MRRERAMNAQTALRSGGAARRQPNDSIGLVRAARDPTIRSRCLGRGAHGTASEADQGANGPGHTRRQRNMGVVRRSRLTAAASFHSLFAR